MFVDVQINTVLTHLKSFIMALPSKYNYSCVGVQEFFGISFRPLLSGQYSALRIPLLLVCIEILIAKELN